MATFETWCSIDMFIFRFEAIRSFIIRHSKLYIWPWKFKVKVMSKVKSDGHIWALQFNQSICNVCFSFRGNLSIYVSQRTKRDTKTYETKLMAMTKLQYIYNARSRCAIKSLLTHCGLVTPYIASWNWVNIGSGNGLLPDGTKPLPEPILTYHQ